MLSFVMSPLIYSFSIAFLHFLKLVDAKTCLRSDGNGLFEPFHCAVYEYCCGSRCCRSPIVTFYHLWYFWLLVFLTLMFCSGGGYWYRLRNQSTYITPSGTRITQTRPVIHPAHGTIYTSSVPIMTAPYAAQYQPPNAAPYPRQSTAAYPPQPPPPYYGPPPSYDTVVNQNQNAVANPSQNPAVNQNQNQTQRQN